MNQDAERHGLDMAVDILSNGKGATFQPGDPEEPIEVLERELPPVYDGQIPLGDLLSRVVQAIYAELTEMAETLPSMSDTVRKRTIADWVVKTKKQVVKLYAVAKWSRDAETVQKCMNITAFLGRQNFQFDVVTNALVVGKQNLDQARLRNHDLLTSLDVLTAGSYLRLPTCIKKAVTPQSPLTDEQVAKTLEDMEGTILYRLRMREIIPVEMSRYRIWDGRVFFTVPKLFEVSLSLQGPAPTAGWFFVHVEFPITVKGDITASQEFPTLPSGLTKRFITDEADFRLAYYLLSDQENPDAPKLPVGVVDTPLVRLYNFLQMMSLSYQLEILAYQAQRMVQLGWGGSMEVLMSTDRKTLTVVYWKRAQPPAPKGAPPPPRSRHKPLPAIGGTITIAIETVKPHSARTPEDVVLARIQQQVKLGSTKPSDEVEYLKLHATWTPSQGVLAVNLPASELTLPPSDMEIDANNLDFESMLRKVIEKHAQSLLVALTAKLQTDPRGEFTEPGVITAEKDALHLSLCTDEVVTMNIDTRTGKLNLRDVNSMAVSGRAPRFFWVTYQLNDLPDMLVEFLSNLRTKTIIDMAEEKAGYLGYQSYRSRNLFPQDMVKLGPTKGQLFIQLKRFPDHYLVLLVKAKGFSYALITTHMLPGDPLSPLTVKDIAFLDFERIKASRYTPESTTPPSSALLNVYDPRDWGSDSGVSSGFDLTVKTIKELYSYCCARVAYMNVERQFKELGIDFTHVNPGSGIPVSSELSRIQSSLARSVPALCVKAGDILSGVPAAEAAMPNIRVIPLNWWSDSESAQVITCVKLKYVQQPLGKRAGSSNIIRPSKRIIYDTKEAVVSFLSESVNNCVDEFAKEWSTVSKMVVIAREVAKMSKEKGWSDIQLLSFDLQTVEFAYAPGYSVSITCEDQLSTSGGKFDLRFTRSAQDGVADDDTFNPHDDAEPFLTSILRHGHGRLAPSVKNLITVLRDTLPMAVELEKIRKSSVEAGYHVDTFAKASGWYRLLYPSLRHALDFRLMTNQRVAILDGSHSLFKPSNVRLDTGAEADISKLALQPIPQFATVTKEAVAEAAAGGGEGRNIVDVNVGVICEAAAVGLVAQSLHRRVVERLKAVGKS